MEDKKAKVLYLDYFPDSSIEVIELMKKFSEAGINVDFKSHPKDKSRKVIFPNNLKDYEVLVLHMGHSLDFVKF